MEENNRKGTGVFYAVVGVATLVVAIIGATFAYFSASADVTGDRITGSTENLAGAFKVNVSKISFGTNEERKVSSDNLVPTNIKSDNAANINVALTGKCAASGYSACHVYKITASSTTAVPNVELRLDTLTTAGKDKTAWKYVVYQGSDTAADTITMNTTAFGTFNKGTDSTSLIRSEGLNANTPVDYYLMIYIENAEASQNDGGEKDVTGTYSGTVTLTAQGGSEVSAQFTYGG